ncbi:MAG: hypothetical protein ACOYJA_07405 [Christensenellales bacterium]
MKDQGFREVFGFDKLGLKQINDTLRALWKKVMGGLDWRDLAEPTQQVIDGKASRTELIALNHQVIDEAERLRNYAEGIEAKADSGVDGIRQVREDLALYATREETAQKIASEVLRVAGETDEKLKNYSTVEQTADKIDQVVADINQELTAYATVTQTAQAIESVVADVALIDGKLALKVDQQAYDAQRVYRQDAAPDNPQLDMLWLDTGRAPNQLKRFDGERWQEVTADLSGYATGDELLGSVAGLYDAVNQLQVQADGAYATKQSVVEQIATAMTQTADAIEMRFTSIQQLIGQLSDDNQGQYALLSTYIRFQDGHILLGQEGNDFSLDIGNQQISFLQSGAQVAYLSDSKLYITQAQILDALRLGGFAFMPRGNGNLSFVKIGG